MNYRHAAVALIAAAAAPTATPFQWNRLTLSRRSNIVKDTSQATVAHPQANQFVLNASPFDDDDEIKPPPSRVPKQKATPWDNLRLMANQAKSRIDDALIAPPSPFEAASAGDAEESVDLSEVVSAEDDLANAQREADEADILLKQAEEEAARFERELAEIEAAADDFESIANGDDEDDPVAAPPPLSEEDALTSMTKAYQEALDAANENVDLLSSQIEALEVELRTTITKMEKTEEDKQRISAEYAFLTKNYNTLKGKSSSSEQLLADEISNFRARISELESELNGMESSLTNAKDDATKWKSEYDKIQAQLKEAAAAASKDKETLEIKVLETQASLEEEKLAAQQQANDTIDRLRSEFESTLSNSQKMVTALRQSLRKTRREKSFLEVNSSEERTKAVENVRKAMGDEVANLKNVLKNVQSEMENKDSVLVEAESERVEAEKLMDELKELRLTLEQEQAKSSKSADDYEIRFAQFADQEKTLKASMDAKEREIADLLKEREAAAKQIDVLQLEIETLDSKVQDSDELKTSNASLQNELADMQSAYEKEKSTMQAKMVETEGKIAALEKDLDEAMGLAEFTEKSLEEARAELDATKSEYVAKAQAVEQLEGELKGLMDKLTKAESSQNDAASKQREATAKQIQQLQSDKDALSNQLASANDAAAKAQQQLKDYEKRVEAMSGTLMQSSTSAESKENELAALKNELAAARGEAKAAATKQSNMRKQMQAELERVRTETSNSISEANVEINQRGAMLQQKENLLKELQEKYDILVDEAKKSNAAGKTKIAAQNDELIKLESSLKASAQQNGSLNEQIMQLKKDLAMAQSDAGKSAQAKGEEMMLSEQAIATLKADIAKESKSRHVAIQERDALQAKVDDLSKGIAIAQKNIQELAQERDRQVKELSAQVEQTKSAISREAEKSQNLQVEMDRVTKDLTLQLDKADVAIKQRDEALKTKEAALSDVQAKNEQLKLDADGAIAQSQKESKAKADEIRSLEEMVMRLTSEVEKEIRLREDVLSGKEDIKSVLEKKLDEKTEDLVAAQKKLEAQAAAIKQMDADLQSESSEKAALSSQIKQLRDDLVSSHKDAQKAIAARNEEIQKMQGVITNLKANIEQEQKLRDDAMKGRSDLDAALQKKVEELTRGLSVAEKNVDKIVLEKNQESAGLNSMIAKLKDDIANEIKLKETAMKERNSVDHQLREEISRLEKALSESEPKKEAATKQQNTLLSTLRADLNNLTKIKDDVEKEKDTIEKDLTAKNFELRNKMSSLQMNAESAIKTKNKDLADMKLLIAELEAEIAREGKARDAAVRGKAEELDTLQASLKAKSQQVAELAREIETIRSNANSSIKSVSEELKRNDELVLKLNAQLDKESALREQAMKDKASSEQKLLAEMERLKGDVVSAKDEELKRINEELSRQTSRADQLAQTQDKMAADAQRELQLALEKATADAQREKQQALNELAQKMTDSNAATQAELIRREQAQAKALREAEALKQKALDEASAAAKREKQIALDEMAKKMDEARQNEARAKALYEKAKTKQDAAKGTAGVSSNQATEVKSDQIQSRPKPKGFGKVALSKPKSTNDAVAAKEDPPKRGQSSNSDILVLVRTKDGTSIQRQVADEPVVVEVEQPPAETVAVKEEAKPVAKPKQDVDLSSKLWPSPSKKAKPAAEVYVGTKDKYVRAERSAPAPTPKAVSSSERNPLKDLISSAATQRSFPKRSTAEAPSSQTVNKGRSATNASNPLTNILTSKARSTDGFPERRAVSAPSSQSNDRVQASSPFPSRQPLPPPSSQQSSATTKRSPFPKRARATPPSSQASSQRMGAPASQTDSPASTTQVKPMVTKNPLQNLLGATGSVSPFPKREPPRPSSSQASSNSAVNKRSLTQLAQNPKETTTKPAPKSESPQSAAPIKRKTLRDLLNTDKPVAGDRKTETKLGGLASPESASPKEEKQMAMKEEVTASAKASVPKKLPPPQAEPEKVARSGSSLSQLVMNSEQRARPPRTGANSDRVAKTPMGELAKSASSKPSPVPVAPKAESPKAETPKAQVVPAIGEAKVPVSGDGIIKEAFQRALLSARLANDAKAKAFVVNREKSENLTESQFASLSQMVQEEVFKPSAFSQQKAFANNNRKTSLFPEKKGSSLSRLLHD